MDNKEIQDKIDWEILPEPPVSGPYYIEMNPHINLKNHDSSIDTAFSSIHTPFFDFFPIDYLKEMRTHFSTHSETWLRNSIQIDAEYYRNQSERMGALRRDEDNDNIEDVFDYQKYVDQSFNMVDQNIDGFEIEEEYPIFPSFTDHYVLAGGDIREDGRFLNVEGGSSLVEKVTVDGKSYECVKQSCKDNMIIEIKDSKAFYTFVPFIYKFKKIEK